MNRNSIIAQLLVLLIARRKSMLVGLNLARRVAMLALLAFHLSVHAQINVEAISQSIVGSWLVTVAGEARTRTLHIRAAAQGESGGATLTALYGFSNTSQTPVKAELVAAGGDFALKITTQANSIIDAKRTGDDSFVGSFVNSGGTSKQVNIQRLTEQAGAAIELTKATCAATAVVALSTPVTEVAAPILSPGDCWKYRVKDVFSGNEVRLYEVMTVRVGVSGPSASVLNAFEIRTVGAGVRQSFRTKELNTIQKFGSNESDSADLRFPLMVGKKWSALTYYKESNGTFGKVELDREVLAFEKINVPAGEFDAFKIVAKGFWTIIDNPKGWNDLNGRYERVYWYAPALKNFVAYEQRSFARGHTPPWERDELIAFKVQ